MTEQNRFKIALWGYTAVNGVILWIFVLVWNERRHFIVQGEPGPPIYYLSCLFLVVTLISFGLWYMLRKSGEKRPKAETIYLVASQVFSLFAWAFSLLPALIVLYGLLHGPDSSFSKNGFSTLMGFAPPSSVSRVYYSYDDLWLDPVYLLRFDTTDSSIVTSIVSGQNLRECPEGKTGLVSGPKWFLEKEYRTDLECFFKEEQGDNWYLWFDPATGTVWYVEYNT